VNIDWKRISGWVAVCAFCYAGMRYIAWPLIFYASTPAYELALSILLFAVTVAFWIGPSMQHIIEPKEGDSRNTLTALAYVVLIAMGLVFFYAVTRDWNGQNLGTLGDFLGGTLNPILTFLTFVGLIVTIIFQQREVHNAKIETGKMERERREDRDRAEKQQFEATFFQMLNYHNSIVNSFDVHRGQPKGTLTGRECFKFFFDNMQRAYNSNVSSTERERAMNAYDSVWKVFQKDLAHYYRFLYNLVRFVNQSKFPKTKYIRIMRAQLSDFEMSMLLYNGLTKEGARFKEYIELFTLFDNLPDNALLSPSHKDFYDKSAFDESAPKKSLSFADVDPDEVAGNRK